MTPAAQVVSLIKKNINQFDGLKSEHVHSFMIRQEDKTKTDAIIVVSEQPGGRHTYGNGIPIFERRRLQIEFYYPKNYMKDMEGLEQQIKSFLFAHKYICYSNAGHVISPDQQNITNTLKFNYQKEDIV
ncbi:hypothetical protein [Lactobacillus intestinalis]|uniref:hypothetical protein n=1 Tax=Lactobacillus intestinalis TaxID=151781 RepID=UPI0026EAEC3D|nr:hypothetical protein [Lactobacillus intestinalis]